MALKTLHYSIFKLVGGLLFLSSVSILLAVWIATTNHARTQVAKDLQIAESVLKQVLASRELQLYSSADVLTSDFGFKQAVATQDKATIQSVLDNHGQRISADVMTLVSLSGEVISSNLAQFNQQITHRLSGLLESAITQGGATGIVQIAGKLYQVILLTVDAPTPIAVSVVGFELEQSFVQELKEITTLEITIQAQIAEQPSLVLSSLSPSEQAHALKRVDQELDVLRLPFTYKNMYTSKRFLLSQSADNKIWVTISEDLNPLFSEFNFLQFKIFIIALLSLALALFLGVIFARNLTSPLTALAKMAQKIAQGDYYSKVKTKANSEEINNLSLAFSAMQQNIKERETEIKYQADHDILTNLFNRYQIARIVNQKIEAGEQFQVILFNIIDFRSVNDTFGYQNGDACLQILAQRIMELGGYAARLNGGELLWIPETLIDDTEVLNTRQSLETPICTADVSINLKLAMALITCPDEAETEEQLFRRLNITIEKAQHQGLLFQAYQDELEAFYLKKLAVLGELKKVLAAEQNELCMFYQPKLNIKSGKAEKAEALIRWNSEKLGFVSPELFIPIAEQAGIIAQLTDWIIQRVIKDIAHWQQQGVDVQVAINLSVHDVSDDTLLPKVIYYLQEHEVNRNRLSFELTESELMQDPKKAIAHLSAIRNMGFGLAIDDFGTGYSSLAYLKDMPVTELKVDKSFVLNLATEVNDQNIVETVIALANRFGLETVAEGVEDQASLELLTQLGCDWIQGYYISRPVAPEVFISWLNEQSLVNQTLADKEA